MDDNGFMAKFSSVDHFFIFVFILVFALTAFWQYIWAFRPIQDLMKKKWLNHLGLAFINLLLLRILFAGSALWAARLASRHHWGVFQNVETGFMFSVVFTVIFLDWKAYYLHRIYHAVPFLWNIHRVHHTDTEVESTTGVRFHPLEQVITALWKGMFIVLLGAPFSGVFIYEAILIAANLFDHSNARLSKWLEPWVRFLFVTPDMHRVHHSSEPKETNSNFGFIFSFWDRAQMTYQADSRKGQDKIVLGLDVYREAGDQALTSLLKQPFLGPNGKFKWSNLWNNGRVPQGKAAKA